MGSFSIWHWIIVLIVVLLLFGKNKIPGLMGDMAKGITAFKKGLKDGDEGADTAAAPPAKPIDQAPATPAQAENKERSADKS